MDSCNPGQPRQSAAPSYVYTSANLHPCSRGHALAIAVMVAIGSPLTEARAEDTCTRRLTVVEGPVTAQCQLSAGESLVVSATGSVAVAQGAAVAMQGANFSTARILNAGTLSSEGLDDFVVNIDRSVLGQLSNTGIIQALGASEGAVLIRDSNLAGDVRNSSSLEGRYRGLVVEGSSVAGSIINSGSITAGSTPLQVVGTLVYGDVRNSGNIASRSGGSEIANSHVLGSFVNSGVFTSGITSFFMSNTVIDGGFVNSGTIESGSNININDSVFGSFTNTGTLHAYSGDVSLSDTLVKGDFINRGTISTGQTGYAGLSLYGGMIGGSLINRGTLDGGHFAPALNADQGAVIVGDLRNQGLIQGRTGVRLNSSHIIGSLINTGRIVGNVAEDEQQGVGLRVTGGDIGADLRNSGTILGYDQGIRLENVRIGGKVVNSGTVRGQTAMALLGTTTVDTLENRGALAGEAIGLRIGEGAHVQTLWAYGTLSGADYALYVDDDSRLDTLTIAGRYITWFDAPVHAPGTRAYLYSNAAYMMEGGSVFEVERFVNRGTLAVNTPITGLNPARIDGDYTQAGTAVLQTWVASAQSYGQLKVSGTATLPSNARLDVGLYSANTSFTVSSLADVISAGRLVSDGTFNVTSTSALFNFGAVKDGNTVDLTLSPKASDGVASAVRHAGLDGAEGAAAVVDRQLAKGAASPLTGYFVGASSNAQVAATLAQALPMDNAALRTSQAALASIGQAVQGRMSAGALGLSRVGDSGASELWSQPFSYSGNRDSGVDSAGGSVIGLDTPVSATHRVGVAFAYARGGTAGGVSGGPQQNELDLWQFLGYSAHALDARTEWLLYGGAGSLQVDGQRDLSVGTAHARYDSAVATFGSSLAQRYDLSERRRLIPSVRLDYIHVHEGRYQERGQSSLQPLLLNVAARDTGQLIAGFDARLEQDMGPATRLRLNLGMGYDLINDPGTRTAAFAGAPNDSFTVTGEQPSPWLLRGGAGVVSTLRGGTEVSLTYDAQSRSDYTDQSASLRVNVPF